MFHVERAKKLWISGFVSRGTRIGGRDGRIWIESFHVER